MSRIDPWAGNRIEPVIETKEFTDPRHPNQILDLTLKGLETDEASIITDEVDLLCAQYLPIGHPEGDQLREAYGIPYVEFRHVGGRPVKFSRTLLQNVATLAAMQQERADGKPVYEVPELIALSIMWPKAWKEIVGWANNLNKQVRELEGNGSGATGETG